MTEQLSFAVQDINEGPTGLSLEATSIAENDSGAVVGSLTVIDPDLGDSHSYQVSDDRFEVINGQLRLKPGVALDHEDAAQITVEVTATDAGGLSLAESFTIDVVDREEMSFSSGFNARYFDVDHSCVNWVTLIGTYLQPIRTF